MSRLCTNPLGAPPPFFLQNAQFTRLPCSFPGQYKPSWRPFKQAWSRYPVFHHHPRLWGLKRLFLCLTLQVTDFVVNVWTWAWLEGCVKTGHCVPCKCSASIGSFHMLIQKTHCSPFLAVPSQLAICSHLQQVPQAVFRLAGLKQPQYKYRLSFQ